ncbi:hypothetical protein EDD86DRAFT_194402, partial [Gorgonomyces haynaldii]
DKAEDSRHSKEEIRGRSEVSREHSLARTETSRSNREDSRERRGSQVDKLERSNDPERSRDRHRDRRAKDASLERRTKELSKEPRTREVSMEKEVSRERRSRDVSRERRPSSRDPKDLRDKRPSSRERGRDSRERGPVSRDRRRDSRERRPVSRDRRRDSRERRRSRDRYDQRRSGDYSRERRRSRDRYERRRSLDRRSRSPRDARPRSPPRQAREPTPEVDEYTRDQRTVFVTQLSVHARERDLSDILRSCGRIRDVRIVFDKISRRSKGIAYVEFYEEDSVPKAIMLSGTLLMGIPILVQKSEAEKNKAAYDEKNPVRGPPPISTKLFIENLPTTLTEKDLRDLFEPFGRLDYVTLHADNESGRSLGYGFVQFKRTFEARDALRAMNGFELMGKKITVAPVSDKAPNALKIDDGEGNTLNAINRTELMARLSRDENRIPTNDRELSIHTSRTSLCVLLKNMFDPEEETEPDWQKEVEEDVKDECSKYGRVMHIAVDRESKGNIYLKFSTLGEATVAVTSLHNRFFAGKKIEAVYFPEGLYKDKFPESFK